MVPAEPLEPATPHRGPFVHLVPRVCKRTDRGEHQKYSKIMSFMDVRSPKKRNFNGLHRLETPKPIIRVFFPIGIFRPTHPGHEFPYHNIGLFGISQVAKLKSISSNPIHASRII